MKLLGIANGIFALSLIVNQTAQAKDIVVTERSEGRAIIREARAWVKPSWVNDQFQFSNELDVLSGGKVKKNDQILLSPEVHCEITEKTLNNLRNSPGKTRKFFCNLLQFDSVQNKYTTVLKKNGEPDRVKVKYNNEEIYTEIVATRLFTALGFPADRMFFVPKVKCYGCTADPFKDIQVDETSINSPREFLNVAIERKLDVDTIVRKITRPTMPSGTGNHAGQWDTETLISEGWVYSELNKLLSKDEAKAKLQRAEREALTLMTVFLYNWDSRESNHRLVCDGKDNTDDTCNGQVLMMVHDLGGTLGTWKFPKGYRLDRQEWLDKTVWKDPSKCVARMGINYSIYGGPGSSLLLNPKIDESGRALLANLLKGFIAGPEGRKRVTDLFRAAHVEVTPKGTADEWADAFITKANEIIYPMGEGRPDFACAE
ncbi:MAG: hypothetical protein V4736_00310 [Bdellovibrionota bacterium]